MFRSNFFLGLSLSILVGLGSVGQASADALQSGVSRSSAIPSNGKRPTVALVLGGGGTRGAAHVGALKVLEDEGIPIDYVVGTSMERLLAVFIAPEYRFQISRRNLTTLS